MTKTHRLSIIIVNYNGGSYILNCLQSVETHIKKDCEIIVVDNHSEDGSPERIKSKYPHIRFIENYKNLGFAAANNQGARVASGKFLLLLNPDAYLTTSLDGALDMMDADPLIGVLGCKIVNPDKTTQLTIGLDHHPLRLILSWFGIGRLFPFDIFHRVKSDERHYSYTHEADWVSGAFLLTRKNKWSQLGGLDENYFMYMEDVDYCKRVKCHGNKVIFYSGAVVVHDEGMGREWLGYKTLNSICSSYLIYTNHYYGIWGRRSVQCGLIMAMMVRGLMYYLMSRLTRSKKSLHYAERAPAFIKVGKQLLADHKW